MKKTLLGLLKIILSVAIVAWLLWDALHNDPEAVSELRAGTKNWALLSAALVATAGMVVLITIRWYWLIRALGLDCRLKDIFRISLVGYLFNLAPMGIVGGDLLKAWMLAREHPGHRAESLASIVVDRVIGLYALFLVASSAILVAGFLGNPNAQIRYISQATLAITVLGTVALAALWAPEATVGRIVRRVGKLPYVGRPLETLIVAVRCYRHRLLTLLVALVTTLAVHSLFATSVHLIAKGIPGPVLTWREDFAVAPLSAAMNVIPLPAGPQEGVMKSLYGVLASAPLKGLVISLTGRIITVLIAAVGVGYYLSSRREVADVLQEAQE